ncbi:hypothetical protein VTJ04DRAFT_3766 [Mycothermus thermophilus]|uniref:uncharacterized protein n=1 Tax=Humicola insolens TaxID=85995 RepID=UPI003743D044
MFFVSQRRLCRGSSSLRRDNVRIGSLSSSIFRVGIFGLSWSRRVVSSSFVTWRGGSKLSGGPVCRSGYLPTFQPSYRPT